MLDDLTDEGYTNLNDRMEADFSCLSRLRTLLKKEGRSPFAITHYGPETTSYTAQSYELSALLDELMGKAQEADLHTENENELEKKNASAKGNAFINDIYNYSQWIGYEEDTAYIFLLRDALLPYVYFKKRYEKHVYPWLISRRFLEDITGKPYVDDEIRLPIYDALENGFTDFDECCTYCRKEMLAVLDNYQGLKQILLDCLSSLKENKLVVVESGYMGTIPMMLKALDDRVEIRLYTTAPFLYETFAEETFCRRYEDIRKFETVYSQDLFSRYDSFCDGRFYVNVSEDEDVIKRSLAEISCFMKQL